MTRAARRAFPVVAVALAALGGTASNALSATATAQPATYEDAEGVVHYAFDPATVPGSTVSTQRGERSLVGGCKFTDEDSGAKADPRGPWVSIATELSFDPRACTRDLAVASYRLASAPAVVQARLQSSGGASAQSSGVQAAAYSYNGSLKVNVEDPPQIDVTSTTGRVQWNASSSCVSSAYHNAYWGWYSPSGWSRTNASWSYNRNCSRAYTNTYGKYRNGAFCATIDTWTEHKKTWFEGRPRGGWYWSYSVDKWGGCTWLLHYEYIVTHP
jgi:hypothetical protein